MHVEQSTVDVESIGRFVSLGGGKHLVRLFMSIENDPSNPGQRAVFASLLRIINAITLSGSSTAPSSLSNSSFGVATARPLMIPSCVHQAKSKREARRR